MLLYKLPRELDDIDNKEMLSFINYLQELKRMKEIKILSFINYPESWTKANLVFYKLPREADSANGGVSLLTQYLNYNRNKL